MIQFNELCRSVSDVLGCDVREVTLGRRLEDLEGWDSMNALRLLTSVEADFGLRLDLRDYAALESVDELWALVTSEVAKCAAR